MITVGEPTADIAPQMHASVVLNAGRPLMRTVVLPIGNALTGMCDGGGITHACMSPTTAAGIPPTSTVDTPGPVIVPPCVVTSPTRAAGGTSSPQFNCTTEPLTAVEAVLVSSAPDAPSSFSVVPPLTPSDVPDSTFNSVPALSVNAF